MINNAQNSQENTANLGTATAYAYKLSRTNPQFVALKLWAFGGISASENIDVEKIPERVAEIDAALCNGEFFASIRGVRFAASEKLLRGIRDELKTFIEQDGGSGAQVLCASHAGVEAPAASVTKCGQRQAPAPADLPGREVSPVSEMGNNNGRGGFASLRRAKSCAPSLGVVYAAPSPVRLRWARRAALLIHLIKIKRARLNLRRMKCRRVKSALVPVHGSKARTNLLFHRRRRLMPRWNSSPVTLRGV